MTKQAIRVRSQVDKVSLRMIRQSVRERGTHQQQDGDLLPPDSVPVRLEGAVEQQHRQEGRQEQRGVDVLRRQQTYNIELIKEDQIHSFSDTWRRRG